jgi:hypothetical protein
MIPTDDVKTWPMIPNDELLKSLANRGVKFVRSDGASSTDPKGFDRFAPQGDTLYVDLRIPC